MLLDHLNSDRIRLAGRARDKAAVLAELSELLAASGGRDAVRAIQAGLVEREKVMSTGIGHGIAIPHARLSGSQTLELALVRYPEGIDFEALDQKPVFVAFGVVGPSSGTGEHVKLLARIARLVKEAGAIDEILRAETVEEVLAVLNRRGT